MYTAVSLQRQRSVDDELETVEHTLYQLGTGGGAAELQLDAAPGSRDGRKELKKWAILASMAVIWVACGLAIYLSEGYSVLDSVYGIVQILSTVGYGDILPKTQTLKLLTSFLVLVSLVVASGCVTVFLDHLLDKQSEVLKSKLMLAESRINTSTFSFRTLPTAVTDATDDTGATDGGGGADEARADRPNAKTGWRSVLVNFLVFTGFILIGTLFFGHYESCSCGDGPSLVADCDADNCEATGGLTKTYVDAFYMSAVTLTTVGFGDETAVTREGKLFSIFWILFGVGSMVNFVGDLTDCIHSTSKSAERGKISDELFQTMDQDGNGTLDRVEFLKLQLVMQGLAQPEEIDTMLRQFDLIDRGNDGSISMEEVKAYYR